MSNLVGILIASYVGGGVISGAGVAVYYHDVRRLSTEASVFGGVLAGFVWPLLAPFALVRWARKLAQATVRAARAYRREVTGTKSAALPEARTVER